MAKARATRREPRRESDVLEPDFYARDTVTVARELIGKVVRARDPEGVVAGRIVETEAYRADDPASHSAAGRTPRAAIMFGDPGVAYVYFIYGMYEMLNFVTEPDGQAGAVLIRALEPVEGEALMAKRRAGTRSRLDLTRGPGKLCRALGVKLSDNGAPLTGPRFEVIDDGFRPLAVHASPRVGISKAVATPWRFFLSGNEFVSRVKENALGRPVRGARG